jgi:hypothetical protein
MTNEDEITQCLEADIALLSSVTGQLSDGLYVYKLKKRYLASKNDNFNRQYAAYQENAYEKWYAIHDKQFNIYWIMIWIPWKIGCFIGYGLYLYLQYFFGSKTHFFLIMANLLPWLVFGGTMVAYVLGSSTMYTSMIAASCLCVLTLLAECFCCQKDVLYYYYKPKGSVYEEAPEDNVPDGQDTCYRWGNFSYDKDICFHELWETVQPSFYHWNPAYTHDYKQHWHLAFFGIMPGYLALGAVLLAGLSMLHHAPIVMLYIAITLLSVAVTMQCPARVQRMYHTFKAITSDDEYMAANQDVR